MSEKTTIDSLPPGLLDETGENRLHVGGKVARPGWKVMNALPGDYVDIIGDIRDMSAFGDASYDMIYASHILEHLSYNKELPHVMSEFARVLRPGGRLFVSVPDLDVLCRMFVHPKLGTEGRMFVMRVMFGGQIDEYDFHKVGLTDEFLAMYLSRSGFQSIYRVPTFGIFEDTSLTKIGDTLISVNMVAVR